MGEKSKSILHDETQLQYSITMQCKVELTLLVFFVRFDLDKDLPVFNGRKREIRYLLSAKHESIRFLFARLLDFC